MLSAFTGDRRKISQRLSNDAAKSSGAPNLSNLSVILPDEASTVPAFLARKPYIQQLQRKMVHAFPNTSVQRFLTIDVITAFVGCLLVAAIFQNLAMPRAARLRSAVTCRSLY